MTDTLDMSLEHQVALMSDEEREELLDGIDMDELAYDWSWNGRPSQRLPIGPDEEGGEFSVALAMAGRGWGKSLTGAQWVRRMDNEWVSLNRDSSHLRIALLGRTSADVRDVMLEGPSGIMNVYPPSLRSRVVWTPSRRRLELPNGAVCTTFSAEEPSQLRGPQFHCFPAGTQVRTATGQRPIETIRPGDYVWTRGGLQVVQAASSSVAAVVTLTHTRGTLTGTPEHPVLTQRGWVEMGLIRPSDELFAHGRSTEAPSVLETEILAVKGVSPLGPVMQVFNLTVAEVPEFFADDVLVHNCGWADELATFKQVRSIEDDASAWDNLRIAVRLGSRPQILATTTPKRVPVLRQLLAERDKDPSKILIRRGKTTDNRYLSDAYLDVLTSLYGGTALGRQELEGEMLDDVAGAMTSEGIINRFRLNRLPPGIPWIKLVSVDPSVAERPHDECGIVVVYISKTWPIHRRHAFVVDDLSLKAAPTIWADIAVKAAIEHDATIVAETNQGANLVFQMIRQAAQAANVPMPMMREVWSTKNKAVRAEPVGGAYARGRCVAAGTRITTSRGSVPVEHVSAADQVLTRRGWRDVLASGMTGRSVPTVEVQLQSGISLTCTPDHPVYVLGRGFVHAVDIVPKTDRVLVWEERAGSAATAGQLLVTGAVSDATLALLKSGGRPDRYGMSTSGTRGAATSLTTRATGELDADRHFTATSGPTRMGRYLQGGMFTTGTTIQAITGSRISSPGRQESTHGITTPQAWGCGSKMTSWPHGEARSQRSGGVIPRRSRESATGVTHRSIQSQLGLDSVRQNAMVPTGATRIVGVKSVSVNGTRDVWNLTVRDEPEFFAEGILVHNCHHINVLPELESQITSYVFGESGYSPDRQDALVQAAAIGLFPEAGVHGMPGSAVIRKASNVQIDLGRTASSLVPYAQTASHLSRYLRPPA